MPELDQLLRQVPLFSALDSQQLNTIRQTTRIIALQEGERLFDLGQPAQRFFLVVEGQVKLYRVSTEGNEKIIEIAGPGKLFAEAVMFMEHRHYPVSTSALSEARLLSFDNQTFLGLLRESTGLCLRLMADLSMRLHSCLVEIDQLTLQNATYRVVGFLLELLPDKQATQAQVHLPAPKNIIASRVSIKPETFSRILHNLSQAGIATSDGRTIHIHDVAGLRDYLR